MVLSRGRGMAHIQVLSASAHAIAPSSTASHNSGSHRQSRQSMRKTYEQTNPLPVPLKHRVQPQLKHLSHTNLWAVQAGNWVDGATALLGISPDEQGCDMTRTSLGARCGGACKSMRVWIETLLDSHYSLLSI
ncbi:hypothetical protein EJ03DRAFT_169147 [Teratosphaeria nubilosa]|uniref:Uncharacterized protein n=1 Tax=Teratosphaeria nubilosa TaxID=161662 RepID=A0A6G1LID4_9PEZI|nr:hypothetical protein EJ03DRAFT_169147 [Teratosphaeria nubilosa]